MQASTNSSQDLHTKKNSVATLHVLEGFHCRKLTEKNDALEDELRESTIEELWCPAISFKGGLCLFETRHHFRCAIAKQVVSLYIHCLYIQYSKCAERHILEYDKTQMEVDEHQMENILMVVLLVFVISCVNKNVCKHKYIYIYI